MNPRRQWFFVAVWRLGGNLTSSVAVGGFDQSRAAHVFVSADTKTYRDKQPSARFCTRGYKTVLKSPVLRTFLYRRIQKRTESTTFAYGFVYADTKPYANPLFLARFCLNSFFIKGIEKLQAALVGLLRYAWQSCCAVVVLFSAPLFQFGPALCDLSDFLLSQQKNRNQGFDNSHRIRKQTWPATCHAKRRGSGGTTKPDD